MEDTDEYQGEDINADIEECRKQVDFWKKRLSKLGRIRRRPFLMAKIKDDPVNAWNEMLEEDETKDIVLSLLDYDPHFFGECPWDPNFSDHDDDAEEGMERPGLPYKFLKDRDVILAYAKGEYYEEVYEDNLEGAYGYDIPECVADDKEVVLVICSKHWPCLGTASPSLRDDKDVVLAAINGPSFNSCEAFEYASERLRGDVDVLRAAVKSTVYTFSWLEFARFESIESEKEIVVAIANRFPDMDNETWIEEDLTPLPHFSDVILDNAQFMLGFLNTSGHCLKFCSERLRSDEKLVMAAVKTDPSAVEHCLGEVRNNLMSNSEFMLSAIKDYDGGELLVYCPTEIQHDKSVVLEAVAKGLTHCKVPSCLRSDPEIALEYLKRHDSKFQDLDDSVRVDKRFALDVVKIAPRHYRELPSVLQNDEEIALETLKDANCSLSRFVFEKVPVMLESKEAMTILIERPYGHPVNTGGIFAVLRRSPLFDNKEFVIKACRCHLVFLQCASQRRRSDRDVVLAALSSYRIKEHHPWDNFFLHYISRDFQLANIDVVVKVIEVLKVEHKSPFLMLASAGVWSHRSVVLAWLERGWAILEHLRVTNSIFLRDREVIQMAVKNDWSEFAYADENLREDRAFVLSTVKIDGRALLFASGEIRWDYDVLTTAIARTNTTLTTCFGDVNFEPLTTYATHVRVKLCLYDNVFVRELLRGISASETRDAPAKRCHLEMLDRGLETSIVFKRNIAQFLGVPLGEELRMPRLASAALAKCGF